MAFFRYKGINEDGKRCYGEIECEDVEELTLQLRRKQIMLLSYRERKALKKLFRKKKLHKAELAVFTEQLAFLLKSGVVLQDALSELKKSYRHAWFSDVLDDIEGRISNGESFFQALEKHPNCFDPLYVQLIRLAEKNTCLLSMVQELARNLQWQLELVKEFKKVLTYPVLLSVILCVVLGFMMSMVVPSLLGFIESIDGQIGWPTQLLLFLSTKWQALDWTSFLFPGGMALLLVALYRWNFRFRARLDRLLYRLPFIGSLLLNLKMAQIFKTLSMMLNQKLAFSTAWHEVSALAGSNLYLGGIFKSVESDIRSGSQIFSALSLSDWLPETALSMVKMGERSGSLGDGFLQAACYLENEAKRRLERVQPLIEPFATLLMGLIIGWIVLAVLSPVYDSMEKLQ
ncbi:type II secretion system F family protein [Thiomicrorhabdus sp.]|uniref:type II secretion system F family protein n=1 Tax=Thiomicrorhabdus sp. TaxID=2039724 RepID=UPI0029C9501A|nr:type II secretion system F family protein [Thiomicrorhabdus sp.]